MKYISLPTDEVRILPFYLAIKEYMTRTIDEEGSFFI